MIDTSPLAVEKGAQRLAGSIQLAGRALELDNFRFPSRRSFFKVGPVHDEVGVVRRESAKGDG